MAQHDYVAANGSGAVVRGDFNDALLAIATMNSGATAPSTTYAYLAYVNTSDGHLYQRNAANTAWVDHGSVASAVLRVEDVAAGGSAGLLRADGDGSGLDIPAQYPPGFTHNLSVTINATDGEHDIDVTRFSLRNDDDDADINAVSALTKKMDVTFAGGANAGGMASGQSLPTSGEFFVFAVTKDSDGTVDVMGDPSPSGANINSGWTAARRIASVKTDASDNIRYVVNLEFATIYPNGGSEVSPANVSLNSRYVESNPFGTDLVDCCAEVLLSGTWVSTGIYNTASTGYFVKAHQIDGNGDIIVTTGIGGLILGGQYSGSPANYTGSGGTTGPLPCRILVKKRKGAV